MGFTFEKNFSLLKQRGAKRIEKRSEKRGAKRGGQASIEYLAVIGFTLFALIIVWLYVSGTSDSTKQELNLAYAKQLVLKIADASDLVYAEGPPAQFMVDVNVPEGIEYASASGKEVLLRVRTGSGLTDVFAITVANLTGDLSVLEDRQGVISVTVKAQRQAVGSVIVNVTA